MSTPIGGGLVGPLVSGGTPLGIAVDDVRVYGTDQERFIPILSSLRVAPRRWSSVRGAARVTC
jgi:hypothetical protein